MEMTKNRYKISFLIVLLTVVLSLFVFVGSVLAWIGQDFIYETQENQEMEIGTVAIEVFSGGNKLSSGSIINASNNMQIEIKNTGTIRCLVRVSYKFYVDNSSSTNHLMSPIVVSTPPSSGQMQLVFADNWVTSNLGGHTNLSCGYAYYNLRLNPTDSPNGIIEKDGSGNPLQSSINLFKTVNISDSNLKLELSVEAIAYSGNIYQELEQSESTRDIPVYAYPYGTKESLPSAWTAWQ